MLVLQEVKEVRERERWFLQEMRGGDSPLFHTPTHVSAFPVVSTSQAERMRSGVKRSYLYLSAKASCGSPFRALSGAKEREVSPNSLHVSNKSAFGHILPASNTDSNGKRRGWGGGIPGRKHRWHLWAERELWLQVMEMNLSKEVSWNVHTALKSGPKACVSERANKDTDAHTAAVSPKEVSNHHGEKFQNFFSLPWKPQEAEEFLPRRLLCSD